MVFVKRSIWLVYITALVSCGAVTDSDDNATALSGSWEGTYTCSQGLTGLTLALTGQSDGVVTGIFTFYEVEANPGVPNGAFNTRGRYTSERTLTLEATEDDWIEQPSGYETVDLSGTVSADLLSYSGNVAGLDGCSTFSLEKQ